MDMSIPSNNENDDKNKKDDHNNNKSNKKEKLFDERRSQWDKHYDATTRRLAKAMSARQGEALDDLVQVVKKRRNPSKNDDIAKLSKKDRMGKSKNERAKMRETIARYKTRTLSVQHQTHNTKRALRTLSERYFVR